MYIFANIRREKYVQLYSKYKESKTQRATEGIKIDKVKITSQFFTGIQNYIPNLYTFFLNEIIFI